MSQTTATLGSVCEQARPELASLGDLGIALVATLGVVQRAGGGRSTDALSDPGFAIDPALVGRVLDYLRTREGHRTGTGSPPLPAVTIIELQRQRRVLGGS